MIRLADQLHYNKALIKFLSDVTNTPQARFSIVSGFRSNNKLLQFS